MGENGNNESQKDELVTATILDEDSGDEEVKEGG